jgi:FkbM family methyltransferase
MRCSALWLGHPSAFSILRWVKLKHWLRYKLLHDTTWQGQFSALSRLLLKRDPIERFVVDVGANDGLYSSNSYPFIRRGWRGLLIEPHPEAFERARRLHQTNPEVTVLNLACSDHPGQMELNLFEGDEGGSLSALANGPSDTAATRRTVNRVQVEVTTLESLLSERGIAPEFGLLTVDTEGHDFAVIRGLNLRRFQPRAIITEKYHDDPAKFEHLQQHGYRLCADLEFDTLWTVLEN